MATAFSSPRDEIELNNTDPSPPANSKCNVCQKPASFMCSSCGLNGPRYCSIDCQTQGWREGHYRLCKGNEQARATARSRTPNTQTDNTADTAATDVDDDTSLSRVQTRNSGISRFGAAQIINSRQRRASQTAANNQDGNIPMVELQAGETATDAQLDEEEYADELRFYIRQIYLVIQPVVICIILSIFWVKVSFSGTSDYAPVRPSYSIGSSSASTTTGTSSSSSVVSSLTTALVIVGQIVVVTVAIVFFFRKGWIKVLIGFFMIVVLGLLGFMTYLLLLNLIQVFFIPLDYITMVFALWNFAVVGLISIFWKGPLWLQQAYLTIMSSLMAFSLTGLEEWTTWMLLGLLAIWDLIAVLCPFGPLRLLIESSRTQQREVPALLYSVNAVWFMASMEDHFRISRSFLPQNGHVIGTNWIFGGSSRNSSASNLQELQAQVNRSNAHTPEPVADTSTNTQFGQARSESPEPLKEAHTIHNWRHSSGPQGAVIRGPQDGNGFTRLRGESVNTIEINSTDHHLETNPTTTLETDTVTPNPQRSDSDETPPDEEDAERSGLKLGLGDFVFYSVLIARAAMYDWITTVCCTVAVLMGLTATIFLLVLWKKALPALPISIALGVMFYFVAKAVLVPYVGALCVLGMVAV
ncbi:hypothetical protein K450DRAFT_237431 [Umbelopsis ramanniana AG]|uniref:Presenilin n=1 Tax=Umbelopsis ramanniana AG TaxID=1314678 RepID=A0AAD5HDS4_UMBRA|nr:uncharacterized protein K450DRAFT_237431 [Umbelopsis ramanniana AG]KAI8580517.1 hypothetical protein K450DRAFT_237431 [Umbelopsis ramanniana AG]